MIAIITLCGRAAALEELGRLKGTSADLGHADAVSEHE